MKTAVAFLIFNRPDTTAKVFEVIRQAKPPKLLVVADGPRSSHPSDGKKCAATRKIIEQVDWPCEVIKNYADVNMGCKQRVASGLSWVFETVDEAIILEDDCLPEPTFFRFCEELLEQYRDDEKVMAICGTNSQGQWKPNIQSYHFSHYSSIWGWASWRRAWSHYDIQMSKWKKSEIQAQIEKTLSNEEQYKIRKKSFDKAYSGEINSWDPQWLFSCLKRSGISIVPSVNLISNIGFGKEATHTKNLDKSNCFPTYEISFPLQKPNLMEADRAYDSKHFEKRFRPKGLRYKISQSIRILFG